MHKITKQYKTIKLNETTQRNTGAGTTRFADGQFYGIQF